MKFIKSPAFWTLAVLIVTAPHIGEQVAIYLSVGSLAMISITAMLQGDIR